MESGFERTQWIEHSRLQDTNATGYLSRNIDLTFVILFYSCALVVIFELCFYFRLRRRCNASLRTVMNVLDCS